MTVKLADLFFDIKTKYTSLDIMCRDYIAAPKDSDTVYLVEPTEEEILSERPDTGETEPDYLELLAVYRKICEKLPENGGLMFHAAVIEANGKAIAFTAKSGTGKTTHISLWKKVFGDNVDIINGDKPIIRYKDGTPYAFGTPWSGKECFHRNVSRPLHAIVILERGEKNSIRRITPKEAASSFLSQIYLCKNDNLLFLKTLSLADRILKDVPVYVLKCNMDDSAAITAYNGIFSDI